MGLAHVLRNSWLFPRYITSIYLRPALLEARNYTKGTLLDIGCGRCQYQALFEGNVTHYIGLDWPRSFETIHADLVGDALRLPISSEGIDSVLATEVMEHLADPDQFLEEVARVLRPGGTLILSTPFLEPLHEEPRDYFRFTPYALRALLERHSFTVRQIWTRGGWWSVVLGSFVSQGLYGWINPVRANGERSYHRFATLFILPVCALAQMTGYGLDQLFPSKTYSLGYVVCATQDEG